MGVSPGYNDSIMWNENKTIASNLNSYSILFVCTGNRSRSVMAAAISRSLVKPWDIPVEIASAGTDVLVEGITPLKNTAKILQSHGFAYLCPGSQVCSRELVKKADLVFYMEQKHYQWLLANFPEAKLKFRSLIDYHPQIKPWMSETGIPDPLGMNLDFYESIFFLIEKCCRTALEDIKNQLSVPSQ